MQRNARSPAWPGLRRRSSRGVAEWFINDVDGRWGKPPGGMVNDAQLARGVIFSAVIRRSLRAATTPPARCSVPLGEGTDNTPDQSPPGRPLSPQSSLDTRFSSIKFTTCNSVVSVPNPPALVITAATSGRRENARMERTPPPGRDLKPCSGATAMATSPPERYRRPVGTAPPPVPTSASRADVFW